MRLLFFALMLVLAGCADEAPVQETDVTVPEEPVDEAPEGPVGMGDFGWTVSAGVPGTPVAATVSGSNGAVIEVPAETPLLYIETAWTCTSPSCDLTVRLWPPGAAGGLDLLTASPAASASGTGAATLQLQSPEAGEWVVAVYSDGPTADVSGTFTWWFSEPGDDAMQAR